ncbi:MAG: helix-turn-helix transcriptional regulator [Clostridia bacterium]|jgi:transcriptional regulator with XRE-family HTH domain|nr:helix-turn-helix transcriptional regulator [Clostridia bacterium]
MNRIKSLREEFGYTQQELANKLDGAKSTIAMYENETRKPSLDILVKLSEIFNCSIDYILCKSNVRNSVEIQIDTDKINIGLSANDYENITDNQKKQIEEFAKFVLKDNLKNKDNK